MPAGWMARSTCTISGYFKTPNPALLEAIFPRSDYLWVQNRSPLDQFDFRDFPLRAGDLMSIRSGADGDFSLVLTVSRLDWQGRAYAVIALPGPHGYTIAEVLLYDPADPALGQFAQWTDRQNPFGRTGLGGFDLWRRRHPLDGPPLFNLARSLDEIPLSYGGDWQILVRERDGRILYQQAADQPGHVASLIKLPIAMLFFKALEMENGFPDAADRQQLAEYLAARGVDGRSYAQLLEAMLVKSEEKAADSLWSVVDSSGLDVDQTLVAWGLMGVKIATRQATPNDLAHLWAGLWEGGWLSPAAERCSWAGCINTRPMTSSVWRRSQVHCRVCRSITRRGTITDEFLIVADTARVMVGGRGFDVVIVARQSRAQPTTYERLEAAMTEVAAALTCYIHATDAHRR